MADNAFSADLMSADFLAEMKGFFEPQRTNNMMLYIEDLPGAGQGNDLMLSIDTFPMPKQSNGVIEMDYLNEKRKVAGKVVLDDFEVAYKDFVDREVAAILWEWRMQVYNPNTGKVGLARTYKKKGWITLFAPNGTAQRVWEIHGMWPSNMDPGDADMAGEDIVRINMSIAVDKAVFTETSANPEEGTD